MAFRGWPAEAFDFYLELEGNNDRTWWQAHRDLYEQAVRGPFEALMVAVEDEFGPMRMFRPNRDTRFSKDKSPYKTAAAAMSETEGGAAYYVQLSADGLFLGAGMHQMATDQLQRFRDALADDRRGAVVARIADDLAAAGYEIGASQTLKTAPRGWDRDHPRIALARRKGLTMARSFERARWQSTPEALERITAVWRDAAPLNAWLDADVGPSMLPPPEGRR
jgi:uncharacterized protein (TIGR02453 family)